MGAATRGLVLAALLALPLLPTQETSLPATDDVPGLVGRGVWGKALCIGCAAAIVAGGELTWGGILILASLNPDVVGACAYQCYRAFAT